MFPIPLVCVPAGAFVISWVDLFYWWGELSHLMWNSGFSSEETVDLFCERPFSGQLLERTGMTRSTLQPSPFPKAIVAPYLICTADGWYPRCDRGTSSLSAEISRGVFPMHIRKLRHRDLYQTKFTSSSVLNVNRLVSAILLKAQVSLRLFSRTLLLSNATPSLRTSDVLAASSL